MYRVVARGSVHVHFWACRDRAIAEATSCRTRVRGVKALYEQCQEHGIVHPRAPLEPKPWGTLEFAINDADGHLVAS